jgi:Asp-tRNA(Asn)/Glu-tRNA(Gln) amidotransferase A subunit family amidase
MAMSAPPVSREEYEDAKRWTAALKQKFQSLFERYDAILSPTMPVVAPLLPPGIADPYPEFCCGTYFTAIANLAELPAASYPCGLLDGLPVGLQIIGKPGREDTILQLCRALEKVLPFKHRPPLVT